MLRASQILVRSIALAASAAVLWGCGQRGPLYLPGAPEASQRATLPETLSPVKAEPAAPATAAPPASVPR
ncbi:lipoprotein [Acidovorax sp.]|uniref:LPS translocon maturation chaperone LptM n=1 Tax=Acidovorax sp. TaxID=1872122 RepID=UPI0025BB8CF9|nr:lipoprotein [Acidovorax sp.]